MAEQEGSGLLLIAVVGVGVFFAAQYLLAATPVQAATAALTPTASGDVGIAIRGKNMSALIPLPFLDSFFSSGVSSGATVRATDTGNVLVQPGGGIVAINVPAG